MWELQGILLYLSIKHRREAAPKVPSEDMFVPYAHLLRDAGPDDEEARPLAA